MMTSSTGKQVQLQGKLKPSVKTEKQPDEDVPHVSVGGRGQQLVKLCITSSVEGNWGGDGEALGPVTEPGLIGSLSVSEPGASALTGRYMRGGYADRRDRGANKKNRTREGR